MWLPGQLFGALSSSLDKVSVQSIQTKVRYDNTFWISSHHHLESRPILRLMKHVKKLDDDEEKTKNFLSHGRE